jgi:hypothetical protein
MKSVPFGMLERRSPDRRVVKVAYLCLYMAFIAFHADCVSMYCCYSRLFLIVSVYSTVCGMNELKSLELLLFPDKTFIVQWAKGGAHDLLGADVTASLKSTWDCDFGLVQTGVFHNACANAMQREMTLGNPVLVGAINKHGRDFLNRLERDAARIGPADYCETKLAGCHIIGAVLVQGQEVSYQRSSLVTALPLYTEAKALELGWTARPGSISVKDVCSNCHKLRADGETAFKTCSGCKASVYCSIDCQAESWSEKKHDVLCKKATKPII